MEFSRLLSDYFTERTWVTILLAGLLLVVIAYYWLAIRAVQSSKWWRIGYLPPLALLYLLSFSRRVVAPLLLMVVGAVVVVTPFVATRYIVPLLPRHPWERNVDGELHVTLTGLSDFDYASLQNRPEIAVLQMANPDVTDQTLEYLRDLPRLKELDLNETQITDDGLAVLKSLPSLQSLRMKKTNITDDGFTRHLADIDRLVEIDVRETEVKSATLRRWKNAREGRKYLK